MASSSSAMQIAQQLQHSTHAWNTITATLAPWQTSNANTAAAPPAAATALPPAATLRSAYAVLHSLHLDALLRAHIVDELLAPFLRERILRPWWTHVEALLTLQQHYFARASAPARFHAVISSWIVQGFASMVEQMHATLQPLYARLQALDAALVDPTAPAAAATSLYLDARRLLHTLFTASLAAPCSFAAPTAAAAAALSPLSPPPLRRAAAMQEYLFKYYRVNFRIFSRVTKQRAQQLGDDAEEEPEEEPQEEEEEAEAEDEPTTTAAADEADLNASSMSDASAAAAASSSSAAAASSASVILAAATALPRLQYDEPSLAQFARTCSLLLDMHFLDSPDQSSAAAASAPSAVALAAAASPPIPPLLPPSMMLDFFFVLLGKYLRSPAFKGVWDRDQLGPLRRWMENQVKPFLHVVITGRERKHGAGEGEDDPQFVHYSSLLHSSFLQSFGALRIREELFSIVLDYPDSLWSLRNLHEILPLTKQAPLVVAALSEGFSRRLLRPGTNTKQILEQYVHLISAVRVLDPLGRASMLQGILQSSGVAQYIRARGDTTRMVVQALWGSTEQQKDEADDEEAEAEAEELEMQREAEEEESKKGDESKMQDAGSASSSAAAAASAVPSLPPLLGAPLFDAGADAAAAAGDLGLDLSHELEVVPDDTQFGDDSDGEADEAATVAAAAAAATASDGGSATMLSRIDFHPSDLWSPEVVEPGAGDLGAPPSTAGGESASGAARYLRQADILSLLIDLCGSGERNEELLLVEYKQFMAERFLSKRSNQGEPVAADTAAAKGRQRSVIDQGQRNPLFDCELELTHVERMKLRFGTENDAASAGASASASSHANSSISELEIMMKDIANSKRIQNQIVGAGSNVSGFSGAAAAAAADKKSMLVQALLDRAARLQSSEEEADRALYAAEVSSGTLAASLDLASRFSVLVLSSEFWPGGDEMGQDSGGDDPEIAFKMPLTLAAVRDAYQSVFHSLKDPRVLHWGAGPAANASSSGGAMSSGAAGGNEVGADIVELELEMRDGRVVRVECQPIHAAILEAFAEPTSASDAASSSAAAAASVERTQWSLADLAAHLECDDEDALAGKLQFWVQKGLLRLVAAAPADNIDESSAEEEPQMVYELVEHASASDDAEGDGGAGGSGVDDGCSSLSLKQKDSQSALVETYLMGALNNFASMSAPQLHHMLKLFNVPGFLYTYTESELKSLLQSLQQRGILTFQDGLYTRAKALKAE